jgi:hypothetical protein
MNSEEKIFAGAGYDPRSDGKRLSLQIERIRRLCADGDWRTLREIRVALETKYSPATFPESSISSQLRNLRKSPLSYRLDKRRRAGVRGAGSGIWLYRLLPPEPRPQLALFIEPAEKKTDRGPARTPSCSAGEFDDGTGRELFFREARRLASMASK